MDYLEQNLTTRQLAEQFDCSIKTITNYVNKLFPNKIQNGKTTYFDEAEITVILETIKKAKLSDNPENQTLNKVVQGKETSLTPLLQYDLMAKEEIDLQKRIAELEKKRREIVEVENKKLIQENTKLKEENDWLQASNKLTESTANYYYTMLPKKTKDYLMYKDRDIY